MADALLDRDAETAALSEAIEDAGRGSGRLVVVEGAAGIGKSALLGHAREQATAAGLTVLAARASELDRAFGFGVVHQLFEPVLAAAGPQGRETLLSGAAQRAGVVLEPGSEATDPAGYAVLHGLYWLAANLAEQHPVVLLVDDLHWADVPSLRFVEYLGRRLDGLAVAVVATTRPDEPGAAADLLGELLATPSATVLQPPPLAGEAVAELMEQALGSAPEEGFGSAALRATGGNPLLVTVLAREAAALGLSGSAPGGERLAELGGRGVAPAVQRRLRPLGQDARGVAVAVAVAGDRSSVVDVAALAGLDVPAAREALDALAAAGVLEPGGVRFQHPLVRAAVLEGATVAERSRLHREAAERLLAAGAVRPRWRCTGWPPTPPRTRRRSPTCGWPPPGRRAKARPRSRSSCCAARCSSHRRRTSGRSSRSTSPSWRSAPKRPRGPTGSASCSTPGWRATTPPAPARPWATTSSTSTRSARWPRCSAAWRKPSTRSWPSGWRPSSWRR